MTHSEALKHARRTMRTAGLLVIVIASANLINLVARSFQ